MSRLSLDEIAGKLYALWFEHMGADEDSWRRDQGTLDHDTATPCTTVGPAVANAIRRQAEWVLFQL